MSDEELYLLATKEFDGGERDEALWAKSISLAEGNEGLAKYKYIQLRAKQLSNNPNEDKPTQKEIENDSLSNEISIIEGLNEIGCRMRRKVLGKGWVITEPLGGRKVIKFLSEAEEYLATHKPQEKKTSAKNDSRSDIEEKQFSTVKELVELQMLGASMIFQDQPSDMTPSQEKKYLAFEFGVIEYFDRTILRTSSENEDSDVNFFNFLIYYANKKYSNASEQAFQFWHTLAVEGSHLKERELGFNSVNNEVNEDGTRKQGHFSGRYLAEAIGLDS